MFNRSSGFSFSGNNTFNNISGHQVNGTIHAGTVNFNTGQTVVKRTKHDEFQYVKCGDMIATKEIHSEELLEWDWELKNGELVGRYKGSARRTIYAVEIVDRQSKYTAMVYEGKDAKGVWEEDFRQFSCNKKPGSFQLFGINRSEIPMLIFHHELIPCAQFYNRKSIALDIYIIHLKKNMRCHELNLWMNTSSGVLFSGPDGPDIPWLILHADKYIVVPTTSDMLKDNTCFRFFANFGSSVDNIILSRARWYFKPTYLGNLSQATAEDHQYKDSDHPTWAHPNLQTFWQNPPDHLPMNDIGRLRFDTVYSPSMDAVARYPLAAHSLWRWRKLERKGPVEETVLDSGLTRFKLDLTRGEVHLDVCYSLNRLSRGWLSQSSRIFDAIGVTEGKENYFIIDPPTLEIQSTRRPTASCTLRNDEHVEETPPTPIYLFLDPLPMSVSELVPWFEGHFYFWSFDGTGQSRMSEEERERWGLPVLTLPTKWSYARLCSWPTHVYTVLQDWQRARCFDPTTSDWARSRGYPEWDIVGARKVQEEKKAGSSWWEAIVGSGISAFGI